MNPDPDRLAFLRAIANAPADNTPRLVYADWLDEHAKSDADQARAAFLRLSCELKPKVRITKPEQEWLAANWPRLVPTLTRRLLSLGWNLEGRQWVGRRLRLFAHEPRRRRAEPLQLSFVLEFWRGFVRSAEYTHGFEDVASAVAADEPLARHEIGPFLPDPRLGGPRRYWVRVSSTLCFGRAVWDRISGFASIVEDPFGNPVKHFEQPAGPGARQKLLDRVHEAVAAAMTARARELASWPIDLPTLGE